MASNEHTKTAIAIGRKLCKDGFIIITRLKVFPRLGLQFHFDKDKPEYEHVMDKARNTKHRPKKEQDSHE